MKTFSHHPSIQLSIQLNHTFIGHGSGNFSAGNGAINNTGFGYQTLHANTSGERNTAIGPNALSGCTSGTNNVAVGVGALADLTIGHYNIAIGNYYGSVVTGSGNILIGSVNHGEESQTIRIGNQGSSAQNEQSRAFIAGIRGTTTGGPGATAVSVDGFGQLGTISSSRRYKEDIADMGSVSERLLTLRPVTFRYKRPYANGEKPIQFGLIAEEVAETFPELAVFNDAGQPETVKYHDLTPLLLNEVQRQHKHAEQQDEKIANQDRKLSAQQQKIDELEAKDKEREARLTKLEQLVPPALRSNTTTAATRKAD